jgi:VWFA-related protein
MLRLRLSAAFLVCFTLVQVGTAQQATPARQGQTRQAQGQDEGNKGQTSQGQSGQSQSGQSQSGQQQTNENGQQGGQPPAFRGGVDFVRVDVIVSDKKAQPVTNLTENDFEVLEDGKPVKIEQFKLIKVDGNPVPGGPPPKQIRNRNDEELEAARDDVRIFVFFMDDYHVRKANSMSVRTPLIRFIQQQLRPTDMIGIMYPLMPVSDLQLTRDHEKIVNAINTFDGRKFDYTPRNIVEQNYARYSTDQVERIRNDVVMGALQGLATRLGSLREGRKNIVFVSEGFTAMLPPQMRRMDASAPANPIETAAAARVQDSGREITNEWFGQMDVYSRLRDVYDIANKNNTAVYSLDPRGLAPFEYGFDDIPFGPPPTFATDRRALQATQDTLRVLSEESDGRAIVNRNTLEQGLADMVRDSSFYYLLGYTSSKSGNDGKFHPITVKVKRSGVDVRARKGYWALTPADVEKINNPTPEVAKPVQTALASIAPSVQSGKYVRTWIGTERGENGKTRVTLIWEPLPPQGPAIGGSVRREQPGRVALLAATSEGNLVFRGRSPDAALASAGPAPAPNDTGTNGRSPSAAPATAPQRLVFDAPPGKIELRMTVEAAGSGGTLDSEIRDITVPDFTAPQVALSTPRVYRARTAREFQAVVADANAVPAPGREFLRTERLLIRFDAYGPGTEKPDVTAVLLNRAGTKMSDVQIAPGTAGATHQIDMGLASIPTGEYLVEITAKSGNGEAKELIPFRLGA